MSSWPKATWRSAASAARKVEAHRHSVIRTSNAVSPSIVFHDHLRKTAPEALLNELASREAFGRGAEAFEIANIMVFLASDYASYLVGEVISASSQRA